MEDQNLQNPTPQPAAQPSPMPVNPSQIYPDPAQIYPTPVSNNHTPASNNPSMKQNDAPARAIDRRKLIIIGVNVLGAYIAIPALLGLIGITKLLTFGFVNSASATITAIDIIFVLLGVGFILRKELARAVYIFLAIISLCLSIYGTIHYFSQTHSQPTQTSDNRIQAQYEFSYCDTLPPNNQREEIKKQLEYDAQNNIKPTKTCRSTVGVKNNTYVRLALGYSLALVPLLFLTRPAVKSVFS